MSSLFNLVDAFSAMKITFVCLFCGQSYTGPIAQTVYKNSRLPLHRFFTSETPIYSDPSRGTRGCAGKPIKRSSDCAELQLTKLKQTNT